jgi:hypothetical protein
MSIPHRQRRTPSDPADDRKWARWKARFRAQQRDLARQRGAEESGAAARIRVLEEDVARLALMCTTLTEVVMRKGLLSREELREIAAEIDAIDGSIDGMLDPAALRPAPAQESAEPAGGAPAMSARPRRARSAKRRS